MLLLFCLDAIIAIRCLARKELDFTKTIRIEGKPLRLIGLVFTAAAIATLAMFILTSAFIDTNPRLATITFLPSLIAAVFTVIVALKKPQR